MSVYNYTTFDVIGDLAFGEPFGCLETGDYHPWVAMIFDSIKLGVYFQSANFFPWIKTVLMAMAPKSLIEKRNEHHKLTKEKLLKRMDLGAERPDLIEGFLRNKDNLNMTMEELQSTSSILIVGGSETTASLLSGVTYLLAKNPVALQKLTSEVRTAFKNEEEIDYLSVSNLPYMLACLDEGLRVYPPAPLGFPRQVPKGGATVAGQFVPEDVSPFTCKYELHGEMFSTDLPFLLSSSFHRRWCLNTIMLYTTMRSSLPCRKNTTPNGGWATQDSRQTIEMSSSRSKSGRETASEESKFDRVLSSRATRPVSRVWTPC